MENISKRLLSLLVAVFMVISMLPTSVFAAEAVKAEDEDIDVSTATTVTTEAELIEALKAGGTVKLGANILVTAEISIPAGVTATLDLAGYAITSAYQEGSTTKHIYPLNNSGTFTIKDSVGTGSITGRGIYNQDGAVITVNGAKIVSEDSNGGAGIWCYGADSKVYLNDATIIGYTGVVSSEGYLEINGGTYTCYSGISDAGEQITSPTYNIRAYNGLKIIDGTFTSRHGVVALLGGEGVIEDGSYTIEKTGLTMTSNVVYVYGEGNMTINGGTFTGDSDTAAGGAVISMDGEDCAITVNDGNFSGGSGSDVYANDNTVIKGGSFEQLNDSGKAAIATGTVVTVNGEAVVKNEDGSLTAAPDLTISTAEQLAAFAAEVNKGNTYAGKLVVLADDIDLNGSESNLWTPIGTNADAYYFAGTFDGQGHTISNLFVKQGAGYHAAGLFGAIRGTVKNLTIDGAYVENLSSGDPTDNGTAVVAGSSYCSADSLVQNVHVKKATVKGNRYVAGIVGYMDGSVKDCSIEDVTIVATPDNLTGSYDNGDKVGGIVGYCNSNSVEISGNELKGNVSITAYRDVAGIVGCVNSAVEVSDNKNSATLSITIDTTLCGERDNYNVGEIWGRNTPSAASTDENTDNYTYSVVTTSAAVAKIGETEYATLAEAFDEAKEGDTVILLADVTVTETVVVDKDVVIDLNEKTITNVGGNGKHTFRIAADVTVKNGTVDNTAGGYCFIVGYNTPVAGNLTVESGNYYGNTTVVSVTYGTANIKGGCFKATPYQDEYTFTFNCVDRFYEAGTASICVTGGEFYNFNPFNNAAEGTNTNFCAEGYTAVDNGDGTYTVGKLPEAEVTVMGSMTLTPEEHDYMAWPSGDETVDRPLEILMNFKALETLDEAEAGAFAKWKTDFYVTVEGLENGSIIANDCYLAGNYGEYGWIVIPMDGVEVKNGVSNPVVSNYDPNLTYENICDYVRDFTAAIHIAPAILEANPNMTVKLELKMTNPNNANETLVIGTPAVYGYDALTSGKIVAQNANTGVCYSTVEAALSAAKTGDTVQMLAAENLPESYLWVKAGVTLDLNGCDLAAAGVVASFTGAQIIDSSDGQGELIVASDSFALKETNTYIPVKTTNGYGFVKAEFGMSMRVDEADKSIYYFELNNENTGLLTELQDGGVNSDITIRVHLNWTRNGVDYEKYYVYSTADVSSYAQTYKDYCFYLNITGTEGVENLTVCAQILANGDAEVLVEGAEA